MKTCVRHLSAVCLLLGLVPAIPSAALAANDAQNVAPASSRDLPRIRSDADSGDPGAQVTIADSLASQLNPAEALVWYKQAAAKGNLSAKFELGRLLLLGSFGNPADQAVAPSPIEGLLWTYEAATGGHRSARRNMGTALRQGIGTSTNLVAAYAWLKLVADSNLLVAREELTQLTAALDPQSLRSAEELAAAFKAGRFQAPDLRAFSAPDARVKLGAITLGKTPMAMINGKLLAEGDSILLSAQPQPLQVECLVIKPDSVLIALQGEDYPRELRLR